MSELNARIKRNLRVTVECVSCRNREVVNPDALPMNILPSCPNCGQNMKAIEQAWTVEEANDGR